MAVLVEKEIVTFEEIEAGALNGPSGARAAPAQMPDTFRD